MSKNFIEDLKKAGVQLLDDDELEQVDGGKYREEWCWAAYCCYSAFMHPEESKPGESCFLDYECLLVAKNPGPHY